jgi:cellobiose dehydrogenase (acceptor)
MTMSQYLGRGSKSRGRMTITEGLDTVVSTLPWLHDQYDVEAIIKGIQNLQASLASVPNLTWTYPNSSVTVEDFVNDVRIHSLYCPRPFSHIMTDMRTILDAHRLL